MTGDDQLGGWTKKCQSTFESQICTKKGSRSLFGGLLLVWSTAAFWISMKPLIWEVRSANEYSHWSTEWTQLFSMTTPDCTLHNQRFKSWTNWAMKFCLIRHIHLTSWQLTTTSSSILTTFHREMLPQSTGGRKSFPRVHQIPKQIFLCYRNKRIYFSLAKMYWL